MIDRIAVISDIHGNRWALKAVLEDIDEKGVSGIVNLGDSLYGPLDPAGTFQILSERNIPTVSGNEDRIILDLSIGHSENPTLAYVRGELDKSAIAWLQSLPPTMRTGPAFAFHGSPASDSEYLIEIVSNRGVSTRPLDALKDIVSGIHERLILCGHSHQPNSILLSNGQLIVNPGSVGLQAYTDDVPRPHAIETGTPHAQYSIVGLGGAVFEVESVAVSYDWEAPASRALERGRADWTKWLQTGKAT